MFQNLTSGSKTLPPGGPAAGRWATDRRLAILRAAAQAFRAHGFAATGMREIAEAAEISPGNLYYYFGGKDEIIYFCQDYALDRLLETARAALASKASPAERVGRLIEAHIRCMLEELDGAVAHLEVDALPAKLRRRVVRKRDAYEHALRRLIAAGVRTGAFRPCDPALVTRAILGAINWTARWYRPDGPRMASDVAAEYSAFLVQGLLP
jgi:AcrR family transcriptional regulator